MKTGKFKFIIFTLVIIVCTILILMYTLHKIYPLKHFDTIKEYSLENSVDPYLIVSIIKCESNFNEMATSHKEAKGLMQIMDATATDIDNEITEGYNIYDIDTNINLGCKYFASLIDRYGGNYYLAICAYNAGIGNVNKWIQSGILTYEFDEYAENNIPFSETKKYLKKVINTYKIYRALY